MKKWKIIYYIAKALLILFFIAIVLQLICLTIQCKTANISYPHDTIGGIVYNWKEEFLLSACMYILGIIMKFGISVMIDIIVMVFALYKLKRMENK